MNDIMFTLRNDATTCKIRAGETSLDVRTKMTGQPWSECSSLYVNNYDVVTHREFNDFVRGITGIDAMLACVAARRGDKTFDGFEILHVQCD